MTQDDALRPVRVRVRHRPQFPPPLEVEPGPAVEEAHGLHDRFVVHGKGWIDRVDADNAMGRCKARQVEWRQGGPRPLLHVSHRSPAPNLWKLTVDNNSLLEGGLTVEKRAARGTRRHVVTSTLRFNASRFFRYHGADLLHPEMAEGREWLWRPGRASGTALSYDTSDNWLEPQLLPRAVATWEHGLARYVREATSAIESELRDYFAPTGQPVEVSLFEQEKAIVQAEVYWEFRADDAIEAARYYGQAIHAQTGRKVRKTVYFAHNAVGYRVQLGTLPCAVSVYAKTPERVRFEIQYESSISRVVPYRGERDLVRRLLLIRSDACTRLCKVLNPIVRDTSSSSDARAAMTGFLAHVSAACIGTRMDQSVLLNLLISTRRLVKPVAGVPDNVLVELVRRDVVKLLPRSRTEPHEHYVVAPRYQWVLARLDEAFPAYNKQRWTGRLPRSPVK